MAYTKTVWVDGQEPAINAANLNKIEQGIADSAPGGYGLGGWAKTITSSDDLNTIYAAGWYTWTNTPQNCPYTYSSMRVDGGHSRNYITQTVYSMTDRNKYVRSYVDGAWKEWQTYITSNNIASQSVASATNASYGTLSTSSNEVLRNQALRTSDTNPTANGSICWTFG